LARSEKTYYEKAVADGYSRETATDYYQKYGTDNISKAQETLDTFKREGVSNENVTKAGENLDSNGIDAYRDTITDNTGKFNNADETALLDQFEKCENKAEYDTLKNSVNTLEKNNIEPSEYETKGIDTPEKVNEVAVTATAIETISDSTAITEGITDSLPADAVKVGRPTWRQSELDVAADYPGYEAQKSFIRVEDGSIEECPYGTNGSVRPDFYKTGDSIDVKNYNISTSTGRSNLANNIAKQYQQRLVNLPEGTKQTVIIDIRGQNVTEEVIGELYNSIVSKTDGNVEIKFKTN
jgi:hypothetical protein